MTSLVNPKVEITIKGTDDIVVSDLHMDFNIFKDMTPEPNSAEVTIYNLGPTQLAAIESAEAQEAPIEIRCTPSGSEDLVLAYGGDVTYVDTEFTNPGHSTHITCQSQVINHNRHIFAGAIAAGTPKDEIVNYMIEGVMLPTGNIEQLDTVGVLLSQTFNGVAYQQLVDFVYEQGLRAYITDGVLNITSVYQPVDFSVYKIPLNVLLGKSQPRATSRTDELGIAQKTAVEATFENPYDIVKPRKTREKKVWGSNDFSEQDVIDKFIGGVTASMLMQPTINPDQVVAFEKEGYEEKYYRTQTVSHIGNNETFSDWTTSIEADIYEDTAGDIVAT